MRRSRFDLLRGVSAKAYAAVAAIGVVAATVLGVDDVRARFFGLQATPPSGPTPAPHRVPPPVSTGDEARVAASVEAILSAGGCSRLSADLVDVSRTDTPASQTASGLAAVFVQASLDLSGEGSGRGSGARVAAAGSGLGPAAEAEAFDDLHRALAAEIAAAAPSCFGRG